MADTTIRYDREFKIPLYAEDNIAEVWLINFSRRRVEVYRPTSNGDRNVQTFWQS